MKIAIKHWRYEDGNRIIPEILRKNKLTPSHEFIPEIVGWHCYVYTDDDEKFSNWVKMNCPSADCTFRFNSGNPAYIVHIKDDKDAAIFKLTWL